VATATMLLPWVYVRTSAPCHCHVPAYLDGKSSDARGALELLPSGPGWFARSFTDAQAASLAQATSISAAAAARAKKII
jgi:hypothetical protein